MSDNVLWFEQLRMHHVAQVGGKNASLGEMLNQLSEAGVRVPSGFATTADAYRDFLQSNQLTQRIANALTGLDVENIAHLTRIGAEIRQCIIEAPLPAALESSIRDAYHALKPGLTGSTSVAVRSSATAEDLPDASFAGQQETFLNITGIPAVLEAVKHVFASLYNDRAIAYRAHKGYAHADIALSVGIQQMVRSDCGAAGVMFTLDTESGFDQVVLITASYGLGESVVQGCINPDEFYVYKPNIRLRRPAILRRTLGSKQSKMTFTDDPRANHSVQTIPVDDIQRAQFSITDHDVNALADIALRIENHYGRPMDIEWAKDGQDGTIYIVQARPETVRSAQKQNGQHRRYQLKTHAAILATGRAIGQKIGQGRARLISDSAHMHRLGAGEVLVTDMTDPDWEPVMKRAAAIVTNRGGRTCHAAIIARELGIPAIVGCGDATQRLQEGQALTVSCAEGDTGNVYEGLLEIECIDVAVGSMPACPVQIMMNIANPERAFDFRTLPNEGVGLARLEFIINSTIGIHPNALLDYDRLPTDLKEKIDAKIAGYPSPVDFYVDKLTEGIATLAAAFFPKKVIVRLSDFKSNEYAHLMGGTDYEPFEENPMLGFRGTSRYLAPRFRRCFELECRALRHVRDTMGLTNVEIMIPFVRTLKEAEQVVALLKENGLARGVNGLRLIMMCEIPSNALLADQFLMHFDGFSIGSNDMTQLTLAVDRDANGAIAQLFDERDDAVKAMIRMAITACQRAGKYVGICGQGPSDHADFAAWLVAEGIDSISLNPDTVIDTWHQLAGARTQAMA